jgi:DNA-binding HxlR family transcriptional regulator
MTSKSNTGGAFPAPSKPGEPSDPAQPTIPGPAGSLAWTVTTQEVIALLGRKWVIPVLRELASATEPKRHFQIRIAIKGVTAKVLTDTLRFLERDGIVEPVLHDERHGSKSIAYQLTDLGQTLATPLTALYEWGRAHLDAVHRVQSETEERWTIAEEHPGAPMEREEPERRLK